MDDILQEIRACQLCKKQLPQGCRPVVRAHPESKILIVGQAPGIKVHQSGIPWDDKSGERLRSWMNLSKEQFYNEKDIAIVPMGLCYPGRGKSGDNPPIKKCAPMWHPPLLENMTQLQLIILPGIYAQKYYLGRNAKSSLTQTLLAFKEYLPTYFPLIHPSPRNTHWLQRNPWFEAELIPILRGRINEILR